MKRRRDQGPPRHVAKSASSSRAASVRLGKFANQTHAFATSHPGPTDHSLEFGAFRALATWRLNRIH